MNILQMSFSASILIIFIMIMRFFFKNRIPSYIFNLLWKITSCKLLLPISIFPIVSFVKWKKTQQIIDIAKKEEFVEKNNLFEISTIYDTTNPILGFHLHDLQILWLFGMILLSLYFLFVYFHCTQIFKMALPIEDSSLSALWNNKKIEIRISDRISSPLTYGFFHPIILLPKKINQNKKNIGFILEHEMAHIKRFDSFWKLFLMVALICHWFNPLVWLMYLLANRDIELACDEKVIRNIGIEYRAFYANFLVEWERKSFEINPFVSNFAKNFIEERIVNIMKIKKLSSAGIILSLALVAGSSTIYAITPSTTITAEKTQERNDPTLGGIFELYTPEELAETIENIKKYADVKDTKSMEEDLKRLKADNGKGEFVIYKGAFRVDQTLENGVSLSVALDPTIIMAPELVKSDTPLTAESYKNSIEDVSKFLEEAVKNGSATLEQKQAILNKMNDNLLKLK